MAIDIKFKCAQLGDEGEILRFIKLIAKYEKLEHMVRANEQVLRESIFENGQADVIFIEYQGENVGYIVYCHNFSTFEGRHGLYIEDIFVLEEYRGLGIGKLCFEHMEELAKQQGCARMEWVCLNWNQPSIEFYKKNNAKALDEWILFRKSLS